MRQTGRFRFLGLDAESVGPGFGLAYRHIPLRLARALLCVRGSPHRCRRRRWPRLLPLPGGALSPDHKPFPQPHQQLTPNAAHLSATVVLVRSPSSPPNCPKMGLASFLHFAIAAPLWGVVRSQPPGWPSSPPLKMGSFRFPQPLSPQPPTPQIGFVSYFSSAA